MDLVVMVLVAVGVAALIAGPLLRTTERTRPAPSRPESDRERTKHVALSAIRELEFDFATGKISHEDYTALRARYDAKALEAISASARAPSLPDLDVRLEAEIAAARTMHRCACGEVLPPAARFCPACGAAVSSGARR